MEPPPGSGDTNLLTGEVARVVFANRGTGFGVVELVDDGADSLSPPRAAGPLAGLVEGQPVRLHGRWATHPRFGPTFEASFFELGEPQTTSGLVAFLSSEHFTGVGPTLAERLVDGFGLDLVSVLANDAQSLTRIRGVSARLAARIAEAWHQVGALSRLVERLARAGMSPAVGRWLHQQFADEALDALDRDPYIVLQAPGVSWQQAEALAQAADVDGLTERRQLAAVEYAMLQRRATRGDTAMTTADLLPAVQQLLGVDVTQAGAAVDSARASGRIRPVDPAGAARDPAALWCLPVDDEVEATVAQALWRVHREGSAFAVDKEPARDADGLLTEEQQAAVRTALRSPVSLLTGGPGTGKTRTVAAIVRICAAAGLRVALCAPTGRAAKRLEGLTGTPATTVHRLLEARPAEDRSGGFVYGYGSHRRLPHDLVIVDEWSMADTQLAAALTSAIPDGGHVLFIGDVDQLPSVGPGAVLRDLAAVAGAPGAPLAATRLFTVHRQAAASRIVTLAHEVRVGTVAPPRGRDRDVFAVPQRASGLAERVAEIVAVRAPDFFGCRPGEVQVLAPMYRGPAGVVRLNQVLRERLNPQNGRPMVAGFCEGDRVLQTRNDPELDVANGDIGEVTAVDPQDRALEVAFDRGTVIYDGDRAQDLVLAWCLTVHKAQGGQWPVVVLVLDRSHRRMLRREVVYTAVTRAMTGLLLVGQPELLATAARRDDGGLQQRVTGLVTRLGSLQPTQPQGAADS